MPQGCIFLTCSSHEPRCLGVIQQLGSWKPVATIIFHYDDVNPKRETNHKAMEGDLQTCGIGVRCLPFTETDAVRSLHDNMDELRNLLQHHHNAPVVLDISVFTKRHLLMMLRWLDDGGAWERLILLYTEPDDYDVSAFIPLSFGLSSLEQIPGFPAAADLSRPVHLALFLGYEGDRALAVFEHIQPIQCSLMIPHPPFKSEWAGRTEAFNTDLIATVGSASTVLVDAVDPRLTKQALENVWGDGKKRSTHAKVVSPLGTKPQTVGVYAYVRNCMDAPAVVYASPLRHNHEFFSHGIGKTWILSHS